MPSLARRARSTASRGLAIGLDRRRGDRQDLLVALERVHHVEAHVKVDEHRHAAHALAGVLEAGRDLVHPRDIRLGKDVSEDVDFSHGLRDVRSAEL